MKDAQKSSANNFAERKPLIWKFIPSCNIAILFLSLRISNLCALWEISILLLCNISAGLQSQICLSACVRSRFTIRVVSCNLRIRLAGTSYRYSILRGSYNCVLLPTRGSSRAFSYRSRYRLPLAVIICIIARPVLFRSIHHAIRLFKHSAL